MRRRESSVDNRSATEADWIKDGKSFNNVAELYDLCRPSYPRELVESVFSITRIPSTGRILEIGSGTG
jgi:hypothetical protein